MASKGFDGMDELIKKLKALDKELPKKVDAVIQANASEMAQTARRLAPIDTGKLRQSIRRRKTGELQAEVTAGVRYAPYIEFGTGGLVNVPEELKDLAIRFKGAGIRQINLRPQPFMWPAFKLQEPQVIKDLEVLIEKEFGSI